MKVIAVNGTSKSGKTTVCETIIRGLKDRGYSVASVKEIHHQDFTIDTDASKDTRRHRAAGSQLVTARAPAETALLYQNRTAIEDILSHYEHDYIILEGVTDCNAPRILTAYNEEEIAERIDRRVIAISGVLANSRQDELFGLPIIHPFNGAEALVDLAETGAFTPLPSFDPACCSACGFNCRELAGRIAHGQAQRRDCPLSSPQIELFINGKAIPIVPFVENILRNSLLGVISELKGYKNYGDIEIRLKQ